jgi:6-phosphofructokinase
VGRGILFENRRRGCLRASEEGKCRRRLGREIRNRTKEETVISDLTYELRSGEASFTDKLIATTFGNMAVECIQNKQTAVSSGEKCMIFKLE